MDYKKILDHLPIIIFIKENEAFNVTFYNQAWYDYTGASPEEVKENWESVVHPEDILATKSKIAESVKLKKPYELQVRIFSRNTGTYRWFTSRCNPVTSEHCEDVLWVGVLTDVDDIKKSLENIETEYETKLKWRTSRIAELETELKIHKTT